MTSERKCTPGQGTYPDWCDRHPHHYWCRVCDGFYGVPHSGENGVSLIHASDSAHGRDMHTARQCACRPCRHLAAGGPAFTAINQAALDAAVTAVLNHPATSWLSPAEELARAALDAAADVMRGRSLLSAPEGQTGEVEP